MTVKISSDANPANVERFAGFADLYDAYRPQPPRELITVLTQLARMDRPRLVVDLGSGTGLSTSFWAEHSERVIGIEPGAEMRAQARARQNANGSARNVEFREGSSSRTDLPDECADIVTCSQSLHWMEPAATFAESARILRDGGVFAAYDCDWPPIIDWEAQRAYEEFMTHAETLGNARGFYPGVVRLDKAGHLARMRASGKFRYVNEMVLHHVETGNAPRLIGIALSQGGVATLLKRGLSESEIGVDQLRERAQRLLGEKLSRWYFCYRVRIGIK